MGQRHDVLGQSEPRIEDLGVPRAPGRPVVEEHDARGEHHRPGRAGDHGASLEEFPSPEQAEAAEQVRDVSALDHDRLRPLQSRVDFPPL